MDKYGVESTSQLDSVKEKRRRTCLNKYGYESNLCAQETKEKIKNTNLRKYGYEIATKNEDVKNKLIQTCLNKYGVSNPMKNINIKNKVRESLYKNSSCPSSKAQRYICNLYNGILNYPVDYYNLDILLDDNIYIEYNGSGHNMNVKMGSITQDEFKRREIIRYDYLKSKGYREIIFNNYSDKLPDDKYLFNILEFCKKYLLDNNKYMIEVDLDKKEIKEYK